MEALYQLSYIPTHKGLKGLTVNQRRPREKSFLWCGAAFLHTMNGMKNSVVFLALLVAAACSSSPEAKSPSIPSWASRPGDSYPEQRYLSAVGIGANRDEAIRDAKKQMAESFLLQIKSSTRVSAESALDQTTAGSSSGSARQAVQKEVSLEANARLRGAEVKEVQKVGSDTYALVVVDKLAARSGLMLEATRLQARINAGLDALESRFLTEKWNEIRSDLQDLRLLAGEASVMGMGALIDASSLDARLLSIETALRAKNEKLLFALKTLKGEERYALDLEQCLQDRGARVHSGDQPPEGAIRLEISSVEEPQHFKVEGWVKLRLLVTARLTDPKGAHSVASAERTANGRSREAVLQEAVPGLSRDLCEKVWGRINERKE